MSAFASVTSRPCPSGSATSGSRGFAARRRPPWPRRGGARFRILLTGATGFLGREVLAQAARDPHVAEVVCVCRPLRKRHRRTGRLRVRPEAAGRPPPSRARAPRPRRTKFRFVRGDVAPAGPGLAGRRAGPPSHTVTHVIHCAASVSFDAPFADSYTANVVGSLQALAFPRGPADARLALRRARRRGDVLRARAHGAAAGAKTRGGLSAALLQQLLRADQGPGEPGDGTGHGRGRPARRRSSFLRSSWATATPATTAATPRWSTRP